MNVRAILALVAFVLSMACTLGNRADAAPPRPDPAESVTRARAERDYTFCSSPSPFAAQGADHLCEMAAEVDGCGGFVARCAKADEKPPSRFLTRLLELLAPVAKVLVWLLVVLVVLVIAIPVVLSLLRLRRQKLPPEVVSNARNRAVLHVPLAEGGSVTDAEATLAAADELAQRGDLARALSLYLAASLASLDRRGLVRIAKHRTNGEYVRSCNEEASRQELREIVREVDRAFYGKETPEPTVVTKVAAKAKALVRAVTTLTLMLSLFGCSALRTPPGGDPAGDELPVDVLTRQGFAIARLETAIASLPVPPDPSAVLFVDMAKVGLEDESRAHLLRWAEEGGTVVLFGDARSWPTELGVTTVYGKSKDVTVTHPSLQAPVAGARATSSAALAWSDAERVAVVGELTYAARKPRGKGFVVGIATDDFLTNVGIARPKNAAALVAILDATLPADAKIRVARVEDGIPPPSNPLSALVRAGLGAGVAHGLLACIVLFLAVGTRQARPRSAALPTRRSFAEHVEATASFYRRARAHPHALAAYARFADARVRERLPRGVRPAAFLAARAGRDVEEAERVWKRAMEASAEAAPVGDELATLRSLRTLVADGLRSGG